MARKITVRLGDAEYPLTFDTHTKRPTIEKKFGGKKLWRVFVEDIFGDTGAKTLLGYQPNPAATVLNGDPTSLAYVLFIALQAGGKSAFTFEQVNAAVFDFILETADAEEKDRRTIFDLAMVVFDAALVSGVFGACFDPLERKKAEPSPDPQAVVEMGKGSETPSIGTPSPSTGS